MLLLPGSVPGRHEALALASIVLIGLFVLVGRVIWIGSRSHRADMG
jgi:hypothetical protein